MVGVVTTIKAKCRRCYTCVRNCPAKAIRVEEGQAHVIEERCIACGNCYRVCAQHAKEIQSGVATIMEMIAGPRPVIACLAPSFPALFPHVRPGQVIAAVRALGFDEVMEVAFGAQLLARRYTQLFRQTKSLVISTPCPAVVAYVQKYVPSLVPHLAKLVSPAVALGRCIKNRYRPDAYTVFIGPCTAKKAEIVDPDVAGAIDVALTYRELRLMLDCAQIVLEEQPEDWFDALPAGIARIFPASGGLLRSAALKADVLANDILVVEGKENSIAVLKALARGELKVRFVDILFCQGCIDGPTMESDLSLFARKEAIADFVSHSQNVGSPAEVEAALNAYADIDLSRQFSPQPIPQAQASEEEIGQILERIGKRKEDDQLNCGACGYATCREKAIAVYEGLAEIEMCLPYLIEQLEANLRQLEKYQQELQETHAQLVHSEKLATVGQLAAGIAHELNNPLSSILLYSHLLLQDIDPKSPKWEDLRFILEETTRCKAIVSGLLDFARQREVLAQITDINALLEDTLARAAKQPDFANVTLKAELDHNLPVTLADPNQLKEVFWNILLNAAQAMPDGGTLTVTSSLSADGQQIVLRFADTGVGISEEDLKRLFTPFYTTKPKGTGLGLAIAYGIIKMHRGSIDVTSKVGQGTTFTITLPVRSEAEAGTTEAASPEMAQPQT